MEKYIDIHALLEKYWEGESSLAEEAEIRAYFAKGNVADDLEPYAPMFSHFSEMRDISTDLAVDEVIVSIAPADVEKPPRIVSLLKYMPFKMGIAAAMVAVFAAVTVLNIQTQSQGAQMIVLDEESETEEALRVTRQALAMLSKNIDKSAQSVNMGVSKMKSAAILK